MATKIPSKPARQAPKGAAAPRTGQIGDNSLAVEEADRIQLISIVSKLSAAEDAIGVARAPLKAAQDHRKTIIGLGKAAGFTADELKARLDEMKTPTREMAERAHREHTHRRWLGILDADQSKLMLGDEAPQEAKDEAHWAGEGLKAGLRQLSATPPTECPERFVQAYMKAHEVGLKQVMEANVPGKSRLAQQAEAEFKDDNPEVDVDAAARKLKNSAFMERADEKGPEDGPGIMEPLDGDSFEATPEELAAQVTRPDRSEEVV